MVVSLERIVEIKKGIYRALARCIVILKAFYLILTFDINVLNNILPCSLLEGQASGAVEGQACGLLLRVAKRQLLSNMTGMSVPRSVG